VACADRALFTSEASIRCVNVVVSKIPFPVFTPSRRALRGSSRVASIEFDAKDPRIVLVNIDVDRTGPDTARYDNDYQCSGLSS